MGGKFIMVMRYLGEITATALLVALGCMSCGTSSGEMRLAELQFGLVAMITVHCFGFVSGGHANPCITMACWMLKYITAKMALVYIAAQFIGAIVGYYLLTTMLPADIIGKELCLIKPHESLSWDQTFVIEFVLTTTLIFGWCALWDARCGAFLDSVSLRIGLLVAACCMAGGQWTGASMNPARALAPAVYHQKYDDVSIYVGSQLAAGIFAPVLWKMIFSPRSFFASKSKDSCE